MSLPELNDQNRNRLLESVQNLAVDTKVIQVDCRQIIKHALEIAGISKVSFAECSLNDHLMCVFSTTGTEQSERCLDRLTDIGIGREMGSISVMSVNYRNEATLAGKRNNTDDAPKYNKAAISSASFAKSVKSRKFVQQMIDRIMGSALLTFDYSMMLVVASLIALGGLATNNSVIVVASMLGMSLSNHACFAHTLLFDFLQFLRLWAPC